MQVLLGLFVIAIVIALIVNFFEWILLITGGILLVYGVVAIIGKINMKSYKQILMIVFGSIFFISGCVGAVSNDSEQISKDDSTQEESADDVSSEVKNPDSDENSSSEDETDDSKTKQSESGNKNKLKDSSKAEDGIREQAASEDQDEIEKQTEDSQSNGQKDSKVIEKELSGKMATVKRVIDGDTLEVQMEGREQDVRLLLVDTPETKHPSEPVQPFGPEASKFVKDKLSGEQVRIVPGKEKYDKYNRLLAYVYIDGETIQEKLLRNGLARTAYLYNDLTMLDEFHKAQNHAKSRGWGVWSIPGYAHVDHNHGYHYEENPKPEAEPQTEPEQKPSSNGHDHLTHMQEDHDCGDFSSTDQATNFMNASIDAGYGDHRLDRDGDGLACEG